MRLAILSSASGGGAGIAAYRLYQALRQAPDVEVDFLDIEALGTPVPDDVSPRRNFSNRRGTNTHFTLEYTGHSREWLLDMLAAYDCVNVHWASYLVSLAELERLSATGKPMLFTLHDFHYITGGCHYPAGCQGVANDCMACPQVEEGAENALNVSRNLAIKRRILARRNVHLAAPSRHLVDQALATSMIAPERTHVLRNAYAVDNGVTERHPGPDTRVLLIADSLLEQRKGMPLAIDSLVLATRRLRKRPGRLVVDIVGQGDEDLVAWIAETGLAHHFHGRLDQDRLGALFREADYLLTCSFEDNWPNILVEAACHGCIPVVGPGHGCEEFVRAFDVGWVAEGYSTEQFADQLVACAEGAGQWDRLAYAEAVKSAHAPSKIAEDYLRALRSIPR